MTTTNKQAEPPKGTKTSGRRLWNDVLGKYDLEEHEEALLREAVRTVDLLDALAALVEAEGLMVEGSHGTKVHPAIVEARQLRIALARVLAALRLPAGEEGDGDTRRPQRRLGARGVYGIGNAS
ncbi:MAG: hypothetical protein WKF79_03340 [Nocardioides sp.]